MSQCNIFNDVKIIFSDIDGTLTNHENKKINPKTIEVLQKLSANGYPICLVTGRAYSHELQNIINEIGVVDFVATCGGSFITNVKTNETRAIGAPISYPVVEWMVNLAKQNNRGLILATGDNCVYNFYFGVNEKQEITSQEYFNGGTEILKYDDNSIIDNLIKTNETLHIVYKAEPEKLLQYANDAKALAQKYNESCAIVGNCFIEIEGQNTNKTTGIKYLLKHYNLTPDNAIFFGDSNNDLPAFQLCKYSCQLGDKCETLKNFATYQLGDCKSSVIGDFLEKEILNKL